MKKCFILWLAVMIMQISYAYAEIPGLPTETEKNFLTEVSLPVDDLKKGDTVYIDVEINENVSLYAFEAIVNYDAELLEYEGIEVGGQAERDILITDDRTGEIIIAYSRIGNQEIKESQKICTIKFLSQKSGKSVIELSSLKAVFDDMTYYSDGDINKVLDITIESKIKPQKPSGGGGGGGSIRPGGGVSLAGGGATSSAADVPVKPEISEEAISVKQGGFTDVTESFWAYNAIKILTDIGVINGFDDDTYKPDKSITRAEFVKIMVQNEPTNTGEFEFFDVQPGEWYYESVLKAAEIGLVGGNGDGSFMPDESITREEAAVILKRYSDYKKQSLIPKRMNINFIDEADISDFAVGSIDALYVAEVLNGSDNGMFYPQNAITRAEAAVAIYNLLTAIGEVVV